MYAGIDDFADIVKEIMLDDIPLPMELSSADKLVLLSLMLRMYTSPEVPDGALPKLKTLCDKLSDSLIARYPFSEGYIDWLYGAAILARSTGGL